MEAKLHRILVALGGFISAVGAMLGVADYQPLGFSPEFVAGVTLAGAVVTIGATYFRQAADPTA